MSGTGFPNKIEVLTGNDLRANQNIPGYNDGDGNAVNSARTMGFALQRSAPDASTPGRPLYASGSSVPLLAVDAEGNEMIGVFLFEFRKNYIPVPGTPGLHAFVAHIPSDVVVGGGTGVLGSIKFFSS